MRWGSLCEWGVWVHDEYILLLFSSLMLVMNGVGWYGSFL
jgi:hypothetical protein